MAKARPKKSSRKEQLRFDHFVKLVCWVTCQIVLPLIAMVIIWILSDRVWSVPFAFQKVFITADLLLLGVILVFTLLADLFVEILQIRTRSKLSSVIVLWFVNFAVAFVGIIIFVALRLKSIGVDFPKSGAITDPGIQTCIAWNITLGLVIIVWAAASAVFAQRKYLTALLGEAV